jgi:hypothetical protein
MKLDMGSMLIGAGLAYYFHSQLKNVIGDFMPQAGGGELTMNEMAAIEAQAEAEVAAEVAVANAQAEGLAGAYGAIHLNRGYGAIHLNRGRRGYGAIHLNRGRL